MRQTFLALALFLSSSAFTLLIFNLFAIAPNLGRASYNSVQTEQTTSPSQSNNGY